VAATTGLAVILVLLNEAWYARGSLHGLPRPRGHRGLVPAGAVGRFGRAGRPKVPRHHDAGLLEWQRLLRFPGLTEPLTGLDLLVVFVLSSLGYAAIGLGRVLFRRKCPAAPPGVASGGRP
jgi:hypothetical protein